MKAIDKITTEITNVVGKTYTHGYLELENSELIIDPIYMAIEQDYDLNDYVVDVEKGNTRPDIKYYTISTKEGKMIVDRKYIITASQVFKTYYLNAK